MILELLQYGVRTVPYLQNKYFFSLALILVFILLSRVLLLIFSKYLEHIASKTKSKIDDFILEKTRKPLFYLIVIYGFKLALLNLGINGIITRIIHSVLAIIFVVILSRILDAIIETWGAAFAQKTSTNIDEVLLPLFHRASKFIFVVIASMWILKIWEVDITPYLAGVGIGGLILGMALQDSLKNVFGGISIILDKNFNIGDAIRLESGELGTIQEIGLRSTKMLTYDNEVIFIPNGQLANTRIRNYMMPNTRIRKIVEFSVEYGTDPEKVKKVVLRALKTITEIYDEPYMDVVFVAMADSGLQFQARFWVDWQNGFTKWTEATEKIYAALNQAKITIPFPTHTVYLKK